MPNIDGLKGKLNPLSQNYPFRFGCCEAEDRMKRLKRQALLDKSVAAWVSALEIYTKPSFPHREETF